jgi:crotonobetainyl-CoA:carnitine CoA-transferase CaiB-like acyl-CoA transferase
LKQEEGRRLFLRLVERSDVVAENFQAGTLDRLGIGYERARQVNPRIIYGSINGFGSSGPYSDRPCVDPIAQAMGGLMSMTGFEGQPLLKTGLAVADSLSGSPRPRRDGRAATAGTHRSGERVEVSMMDSVPRRSRGGDRTSMTGDPLPARGAPIPGRTLGCLESDGR